ncbi:hypothetical protein ACIQU5_27925 [Streptomyces sp. NPDC090306]|uniref:hypothetical protein n=1 Tax=Streptomyces sp. NPDC090306 TaxID=3365961 RepID=UPI0037F5F9D4
MAIGYAHTLFCDRRGCRAKVTVEETRNAAHARELAQTRHGWGCDSKGDRCPTDRRATLSHDSRTTSCAARDTQETR